MTPASSPHRKRNIDDVSAQADLASAVTGDLFGDTFGNDAGPKRPKAGSDSSSYGSFQSPTPSSGGSINSGDGLAVEMQGVGVGVLQDHNISTQVDSAMLSGGVQQQVAVAVAVNDTSNNTVNNTTTSAGTPSVIYTHPMEDVALPPQQTKTEQNPKTKRSQSPSTFQMDTLATLPPPAKRTPPCSQNSNKLKQDSPSSYVQDVEVVAPDNQPVKVSCPVTTAVDTDDGASNGDDEDFHDDADDEDFGDDAEFEEETTPVRKPKKAAKTKATLRSSPRAKKGRNATITKQQQQQLSQTSNASNVSHNSSEVASASSKSTSKPPTKATTKKAKKNGKKSKAASKASPTPPPSQQDGEKSKASQEANLSQSTSSQSSKTKAKAKSTPKGKGKTAADKSAKTPSKTTKTAKAGTPASAKKKKKTTFQDDLLRYMFGNAKPCNLKLLCDALKTGESAVNFCMMSLVDKEWVMKKEFVSKKASGRTKELYWPNLSAVSKSKELQQALGVTSVTPDEVRGAVANRQMLAAQLSGLERELAGVLAQPSNADLTVQIAQAKVEVEELEKRRQETVGRIDAASPSKPSQPRPSQKRLKKQINTMRGEWKKRRDKCMDFIDQLADGMEKKVKDVVKMLELETDEMTGAVMPPKYETEDAKPKRVVRKRRG